MEIILAIILFMLFRRQTDVSPKVKKVLSNNLIEDIKNISKKANVPAYIVGAIVVVESGGNPLVRGSSGEIGLMQITPAALEDVNNYFKTNYFFSEMYAKIPNLIVGTLYLKLQHIRMKNWDDAIRAYNAGERGAREGKGFEYLNKVRKWM